MASLSEIAFRRAVKEDVELIVSLVNSTYRGDSSRAGWTTEADMLGGQRTDGEAVASLIEKTGSLILLCSDGMGTLGSVHLEKSGDCALLGMLAVRPKMQGRGIGKRILDEAEKTVKTWGICTMRMAVLTFRTELISFYERRGFRKTGRFHAFPGDPRFGIPRVEGLRFEWLEKEL